MRVGILPRSCGSEIPVWVGNSRVGRTFLSDAFDLLMADLDGLLADGFPLPNPPSTALACGKLCQAPSPPQFPLNPSSSTEYKVPNHGTIPLQMCYTISIS